jgi:hypothetical protein
VRRSASLAAAALACAGCATALEKIEIDQGDVPSAGARLFLPLEHAERLEALRAGEREAAVGRHLGLALEADWSGEQAEQALGPGDVVQLDDVLLIGPGTLEHDFELASLRGEVVTGSVFPNGTLVDLVLGLNATMFDLETELVGARDSLHAWSLGPLFGLRLGWVSPWRVALLGRFDYSTELGLDSGTDSVETRRFELGLRVPFTRWAALDGGWRWRDYDAERSASDVELDLDGPFLTLAFGPY